MRLFSLPKRRVKRRLKRALRTSGLADYQDMDGGRLLSDREKHVLYKNWSVPEQSGASIPSAWLDKALDEMTLAEAIEYLRLIQSGESWGDIWKKGLGPDRNSEMSDHEYLQFFGDPIPQSGPERERFVWTERW